MRDKKIRALVEETKENIEAFGKLYDMLAKNIYSFIVNRVLNPTEAEDLTACTFEKALRAFHHFDMNKGSFEAWLYRIANNVIIDYVRHESHIQISNNLDEALKICQFNSRIEPDFRRYYLKVIKLINELPPKHQEILFLKFLEGKNNKQIAEILGRSHNYISTRATRALRALRKRMEEKGILEELRGLMPDG